MPQEFDEVTDKVHALALPGQSMLTLFKLLGPPMLPQLTVQKYPVAFETGEME